MATITASRSRVEQAGERFFLVAMGAQWTVRTSQVGPGLMHYLAAILPSVSRDSWTSAVSFLIMAVGENCASLSCTHIPVYPQHQLQRSVYLSLHICVGFLLLWWNAWDLFKLMKEKGKLRRWCSRESASLGSIPSTHVKWKKKKPRPSVMLLKFPCWGDGCRMPLGLSGQPVYLTSEFLASEGLGLLKKKGRMSE